jgi:alpha-beta hydrolase superfamily lysophospholipase
VVLIGSSMGATAALTWAANHRADTACVVGWIPAVDLQAIRVADTGGLRASIDTAYGVTYPASLPAGTDPATLDYDGLPIQLWTASDDEVSVNAQDIATDHHDLGALDHTSAAVAAVDLADVHAFISAHTL